MRLTVHFGIGLFPCTATITHRLVLYSQALAPRSPKMPRYIGALRQTEQPQFTGSARILPMSTRRHLRTRPALECGSLLPLYCQPACWLQIVFPVESPASKLDGRKAAVRQ